MKPFQFRCPVCRSSYFGTSQSNLADWGTATGWCHGRSPSCKFSWNREREDELVNVAVEPPPIDMVLHCPQCMTPHIDEPNGAWTNPPHRSHLCAECGCIWRPADVPTNGVAAIKSRGRDDTWPL
jgi:hypothetical protein